MKRLFPRAVPAALSLLGLLGFVSLNEGCSPKNDVEPGAPVLTGLTIVENGSTNTSIPSDAVTCAATIKGGDDCLLVDVTASADAGADAGLTGSAAKTCQTATSDWCRCLGDPSMGNVGTWDCDPFAPTSMVYATFDRLLDTTPLASGDGIATLKAMPEAPTAVTTSTSYSPMGAPTYFFFAGGPNVLGPTLTINASPAMPTGTTVTLALDKTKVLAKDGTTPFTGPGAFADGTLKFNTAAFDVQIGVPTAPPPDAATSTDAATDAGADAATSTDAATDAGADAATSTDAATDAGADGGVTDAATAEVGPEAGASDAGTTSDAAAADATTAAPPTPGAPVPADMNMGTVTLTFNNIVDTTKPKVDGGAGDAATADAGASVPNAAIQSHITITEDGKPFTAFTVDVSNAPTITITPTTMWAPGKTYVVTVDATAADVVGDTLKTPATAVFVMAN
jgi:hypothetical protein